MRRRSAKVRLHLSSYVTVATEGGLIILRMNFFAYPWQERCSAVRASGLVLSVCGSLDKPVQSGSVCAPMLVVPAGSTTSSWVLLSSFELGSSLA